MKFYCNNSACYTVIFDINAYNTINRMKNRFINLLVVGLFTLTIYSCGTTANLSSKMNKLELGMSKKEAVKIVGDSYKSLGAISTYEGNLETIRYESTWTQEYYIVRFLDGKLVEWFIEPIINKDAPNHPAH